MNNYQKHLKQINELKGRPKLLIHICCGVCGVYPLLYLRKYFDITIYFTNSNIYPYTEFLKRLEALEEYLEYLNDSSIKLVVAPYDYEKYKEKLHIYKDEPEGRNRCKLCYTLRMDESFAYASKYRFDYCTTVMSISNRKNAEYINEIGEVLEKKYPGVKYLYADFKKGDGITMNEKLNKELKLYHQNYCGCEFSIR
ncbi:MAG: epoxyqueuosine reductase QueH [Erysipelotrichaceae bacterium]|nr:epoxyqueuosine reductase QueH [Erysipelotrichaceae bacterium]